MTNPLTSKARANERPFCSTLVALRRLRFFAICRPVLLSASDVLITLRSRYVRLPILFIIRSLRLTRGLRISRRVNVTLVSSVIARSLRVRHVSPFASHVWSHGYLLHPHHFGGTSTSITRASLFISLFTSTTFSRGSYSRFRCARRARESCALYVHLRRWRGYITTVNFFTKLKPTTIFYYVIQSLNYIVGHRAAILRQKITIRSIDLTFLAWQSFEVRHDQPKIFDVPFLGGQYSLFHVLKRAFSNLNHVAASPAKTHGRAPSMLASLS